MSYECEADGTISETVVDGCGEDDICVSDYGEYKCIPSENIVISYEYIPIYWFWNQFKNILFSNQAKLLENIYISLNSLEVPC